MICFIDIDNVGIIGRYFMIFEMMVYYVFNYFGKLIYWMDEIVELVFEFFIKELKMKLEDIIFKENFWVGGGNVGLVFEVFYCGFEVVMFVFM